MGIDATVVAQVRKSEEIERQIAAGDVDSFRMLTGDRPTGPLHIGHYFGTLQNRVRLQKLGVETLLVVADYQVLTDRTSTATIREFSEELVIDYLATGIDPEKAVIFAHSAVPALNQLVLPFLSLVSTAELERNPTVKDELANADLKTANGLMFIYPVHQAADILFARANVVPAGRDQLPHLEIARDIARRFNARYRSGRTDLFEPPFALLSDAPLLLGLDGAKMSKSRHNTVPLRATADETAALVKRAKTDSQRTITYEPDTRPEVASLLTIAALAEGIDQETLAAEIRSGGSAALKIRVTEALNEHLRPIRERRTKLEGDRSYVRSVLAAGNERANAIAATTLDEVRDSMGM